MKIIKLNMNKKLKKGKIAYFSLPPGKPICKFNCPNCYALRLYRIRKKVRNNYLYSYQLSKTNKFVGIAIQEINKIKDKIKAIRIHDSGDFYSQGYINKWHKIISTFPNIKFFTLTKRAKDFDFSKLLKLNNFVLIDSLKFDRLNYGNKEEMIELSKKTGAYICPATLTKDKITCGNGCDICLSKEKGQSKGVLFIKH